MRTAWIVCRFESGTPSAGVLNWAAVTSPTALDLLAVTYAGSQFVAVGYGGDGNDHMYGDDANDSLYGGAGQDQGTGQNGDAQPVVAAEFLERFGQLPLSGVAEGIALFGVVHGYTCHDAGAVFLAVDPDHPARRRSTASLISGMRSLPKYMSSPPTKIVGEP